MKPIVPRRPGRPTKQTDRTLSRLEEALTKGLPRYWACTYAKISRQTFNTWLQKPTFKAMVERWEAEAMFTMVAAAKREPRGNQWLLARRFRDDFGDKLEVDLDVGPLPVAFVNYKDGIEGAATEPETRSTGDRKASGET